MFLLIALYVALKTKMMMSNSDNRKSWLVPRFHSESILWCN